MELDAATLSALVAAVASGVASGVAAALKYGGKGKKPAPKREQSSETAVERRVKEERAEEGRLVRIEQKVDQVLTGQAQHASDDNTRFASLSKELQETRHDWRDKIADLPTIRHRINRVEDDLRITRRQAGLTTEVIRVRPDDD